MPHKGSTERGRISIRAIVIVAVLAMVGALALAMFRPAKPSAASIALDAKLKQLRADAVPLTAEQIARVLPDPDPEHDARLVLRDALALAPRSSTSKDVPFAGGPLPRRGSPIPELTMQGMAARLSTSDEVLKAIPNRLDGVWFSMGWTNGFTNLLSLPTVEIRALTHTLALKAMYEAERGDSNQSAEALRKGFSFVLTVPDDALVDTMIRSACAGIMCDASEQALNRIGVPTDQLAEIQRRIRPEIIDDFEHTFIVERHMGMFAMDTMRAAHQSIAEKPVAHILWKTVEMFRWRAKPMYRDEDYLLFLKDIDQRRALHTRPALERLKMNEQLDAHYRSNTHSFMAEMIAPNWARAMRYASETRARLIALHGALAIERYRLAHNAALPGTLADLAPQYLPSTPHDPFDNQPLRFKKLPTGYVIYSIGADGIDNGGIERPNQKATNNYDVTITVER